MGVYPEAFYKYYTYNNSLSHKWYFGRFNGDIILNESVEEFLKRFGPISKRNHEALARIFANAVSDSLEILYAARGFTVEKKLRELRKAVDYHVTSDMMSFDNDDVALCRRTIFNATINFGLELKQESDDLRAALTLISPDCAALVAVDELGLYARESALQDALFSDDMTELVG